MSSGSRAFIARRIPASGTARFVVEMLTTCPSAWTPASVRLHPLAATGCFSTRMAAASMRPWTVSIPLGLPLPAVIPRTVVRDDELQVAGGRVHGGIRTFFALLRTGFRGRRQSPWMNASTISRAMLSVYCSGGCFIV